MTAIEKKKLINECGKGKRAGAQRNERRMQRTLRELSRPYQVCRPGKQCDADKSSGSGGLKLRAFSVSSKHRCRALRERSKILRYYLTKRRERYWRLVGNQRNSLKKFIGKSHVENLIRVFECVTLSVEAAAMPQTMDTSDQSSDIEPAPQIDGIAMDVTEEQAK